MDRLANRRLDLDALRQRLRQRGSAPPPAPPAPTGGSLEALLGESELPGCYGRTERYAASHRHAGLPLHGLWACPGESLALLAKDPALSRLDFRRCLFIDTETNGLAGGSGTYAFLVGVAYWEGEEFLVRQFFMRHPGEEPALLAALAPLLERFSGFVSFNGKAFDLSVLEARFILARQPRPLKQRPHLDLLHPARRLWKRRLPSCSLGTLEARILGSTRSQADVPGYLIPQLYNDYLRDGEPGPLEGIFYHNAQDLLALAALALHMVQLCHDPERHAPHGQDIFSLALLFESAQQWAEAERCYRRALAMPLLPRLRAECLQRLSFLFKRLARWPEAADLWHSLLGQGELYPYEELAKYHEHQRQDYRAAKQIVCAALDAAATGALRLDHTARAALQHRLARLEGKQQRAAR